VSFLTILFISAGLSVDSFAVALTGAMTLKQLSVRIVARPAFFFSLFQGTMPVIGWIAGLSFIHVIAGFDHWIAFGLLSFLGGKMIWGATHCECEDSDINLQSVRAICLLAVATSIDALAVGVTFAFLDTPIIFAALMIGLVTAIGTSAGMLLGKRIGSFCGSKVEIIGGLVLVGIGVKILLSHLLA
jgi:putative Mn2+ efflux pump MntP